MPVRDKVGMRAIVPVVAVMVEQVGMADYAHKLPSALSGGQQQSVAIARALANDPEVLLADEPTGNLDSKTTDTVMKLMLGIAKEKDQTLIIVTHDPYIAEYADKVVYIIDGNVQKIEIKEEGTREYVYK